MAKTPTKAQTMAVRPLTVEVRSETTPGESYVVTLPHCPCLDFFYRHHRGQDPLCKHLRAAYDQAGWVVPEQAEDEATAAA